MKPLLITLFLTGCIACNRQDNGSAQLQNRIDSLEKKLADSYKPGFGEFMSSIQSHHAKLWFAGQALNWKLAEFEIHEIAEGIEAVQKYKGDRKETAEIGMINPALDSVSLAIKQEDPELFRKSYALLTNTCNKCHRATQFEFNVVKIPGSPSFSNQEFEVKKVSKE